MGVTKAMKVMRVTTVVVMTTVTATTKILPAGVTSDVEAEMVEATVLLKMYQFQVLAFIYQN